MDSIKYRIISIGAEKNKKYSIFKEFGAVPLGNGLALVCDLNNRLKMPVKWITYQIILKNGKKTFKEQFLHLFKKKVYLDGYILSPANKKQKIFRYQSAKTIFPQIKNETNALAIQFTA